MRILIDMDGTIEDLCSAWIAELNKRHGTDVKFSDIDCWDITTKYPTITKEEVYDPLLSEEFWKTVKPIDGAVEYVKRIIDDGHDVYIVTASYPETIAYKYSHVICKYFPYIKPEQIVVTSNKSIINGDILIDDAPHNFKDWRHIGILVDAPYNKWFNESKDAIVRADSWKKIYIDVCLFADILKS